MYFSASTKLDSLVESDVESLSKFLYLHREHQDKFTLKIFYDIGESIEFSNHTPIPKTHEKLEELRREINSLEGDEQLSVSLSISKQLLESKGGVLVDNVYSLDALSSYLNSLTLAQLHRSFSERYWREGVSGVALIGDYNLSLHTDYFYFIPKDEFNIDLFEPRFSHYRSGEIHRLRGSLGHFANASEWFLLPEHFKIKEALGGEFTSICLLFNALHNAYLISFLSNFAIINE
ncbi:hypothetical protein BZG10_15430, partial [Salinivibrio kushneri]